MAKRLTKRIVDLIHPGPADSFVWDTDLKGFGLKVTPAGRKSFVAQYRHRGDGRTRRVTIGSYGALTVEEARAEARRILGEAATGKDPASVRQRARAGDSFGAVLEQFLRHHVEVRRKKRTGEEYRRIARLHLLPRWSERSLTELTRADVVRLHREMADAPYAANRTVALLSKFFNWCESQGLRPDNTNPCRHVEKYREEKRERFLSLEELSRLGKVLDQEEREAGFMPWIIGAIRLLIFTGARLNEILTLQWAEVDVQRGVLSLADSKTGRKTIYLNPFAVDVLRSLPRLDGNPFVICGGRNGRHLVNLEKPWRGIRARAGLEDVRLHDLRHSFASVAAASGLSLPIIGKLLGHTQPQTTARYAHLSADPLKEANRRIGEEIMRAMKDTSGPG